MLEVEDIKHDQHNVLKIVVGPCGRHIIKDNGLCRTEVDPIVVERPNVHHIIDKFIDDDDEQSSPHQSGLSDDE